MGRAEGRDSARSAGRPARKGPIASWSLTSFLRGGTPDAPPAGCESDRRERSPLDGSRPRRSLAGWRKERGIDPRGVRGSGPSGASSGRCRSGCEPRVHAATSTQPKEAARPPPAAETAKGEVEVRELSKLQQTVARRMSESKATAPTSISRPRSTCRRPVAARAAIKAVAGEGDVVPSFNDMVVKACAIALREFPKVNGAYKDGRFELYSRVNVGVAVAAQEALVVPHRLRRRQEGAAADRRRFPRRRRQGPRRLDHPARARGWRPSPSPTWGCSGSTTSRP